MNKEVLQQKQSEVEAITTVLKSAKSFLVFDYLGINAKELTLLRKKLHDGGAKLFIAKNNVFNRAIKNIGVEGFSEMSGPTALIVSTGDEIVSFKLIHELAQKHQFIKYKDGILENAHIAPSALSKIASIPGRQQLYSSLLSCLQGTLRNFLYTLTAYANTKK
ncbi:MAG: 50S ribosomal protein L10 [Mycoplasmataceae bacterium]|jgi:large subunit ribosomal protein L10|nr:50S ribosomal protein L10 [Mycoplasmataceae bacterium]